MKGRRERIAQTTHARNMPAAFGQMREVAGQDDGLLRRSSKRQRLLDNGAEHLPRTPRGAGEKPILTAPRLLLAPRGGEHAGNGARAQCAEQPQGLPAHADKDPLLREDKLKSIEKSEQFDEQQSYSAS